MLTTIEGTYENGQIVLKEKPKDIAKADVIVVFTEKIAEKKYAPTKRPFGLAKGKIHLSDDFDEPLDDLKDYM